jgi:hypothetical protein
MSTTTLDRRKVLTGLATVPAAGLTSGVALADPSEGDAELRALWAEYVQTWTTLQDACTKEHQARCAAYKDKKRLPPAYFYERIDSADDRARRRWVAVEGCTRTPFIRTGRKFGGGEPYRALCRARRLLPSPSNVSVPSWKSIDSGAPR